MWAKFVGFLAVAFGFAVTQAALAAPVVVPNSWAGFYIGGNGGYGWGSANDAMTLGGSWLVGGGNISDSQALTPLGNGQLKPDGFTGGVQAGYNYQTGQWVFGVEADANYFGMKDSFSRSIINPATAASYAFSSSFESSWLVTVRPRIGYAMDRLLLYATGGLAIAHQKFSQTITQLNTVFTQAGSVSDTTVGWTVGVGAEYALGNHWSVKAEYLYVDPGSVSFSSSGVGACGAPACSTYTGVHSAHLKANMVRVGFNYNFN